MPLAGEVQLRPHEGIDARTTDANDEPLADTRGGEEGVDARSLTQDHLPVAGIEHPQRPLEWAHEEHLATLDHKRCSETTARKLFPYRLACIKVELIHPLLDGTDVDRPIRNFCRCIESIPLEEPLPLQCTCCRLERIHDLAGWRDNETVPDAEAVDTSIIRSLTTIRKGDRPLWDRVGPAERPRDRVEGKHVTGRGRSLRNVVTRRHEERPSILGKLDVGGEVRNTVLVK